MREPKIVGLCALCEIPMCSAKHTPPRGAWYDKHKGRGLCSACYGVQRRAGSLERFPRSTKPWAQTFQEFQELRPSGMTRREIAKTLGITITALDKAKKKGRGNKIIKGKTV